jgi:hypothetical protein
LLAEIEVSEQCRENGNEVRTKTDRTVDAYLQSALGSRSRSPPAAPRATPEDHLDSFSCIFLPNLGWKICRASITL